jgi:hypothetical protein
MTRYFLNKKDTVEDCRCFSVSELGRKGLLRQPSGWSSTLRWFRGEGADREETGSIGVATVGHGDMVTALVLDYAVTRHSDEKVPCHYRIQVERTPCNFGGWRHWFVCPLSVSGHSCGRRVTKLYLPPGGTYFGCRHCYNLTYESVQSHDKRVDALAKLPTETLLEMSKRGGGLLPLQAAMKKLHKWRL